MLLRLRQCGSTGWQGQVPSKRCQNTAVLSHNYDLKNDFQKQRDKRPSFNKGLVSTSKHTHPSYGATAIVTVIMATVIFFVAFVCHLNSECTMADDKLEQLRSLSGRNAGCALLPIVV